MSQYKYFKKTRSAENMQLFLFIIEMCKEFLKGSSERQRQWKH